MTAIHCLKLPTTKKITASCCLLAFIFTSFLSGCATNAAAQLDSSIDDGVRLLAQYDFKEAELKFDEITKIAPTNAAGYNGLLTARLLQNKTAAARQAIEAGLKKVATPDMYVTYANYLVGQDDAQNAEANYKKAISMKAATRDTYVAYAQFLENTHADDKKRLAVLQQADKKFSNDYKIWNLFMDFYNGSYDGNATDLLAATKKSITLNPNQFAAYQALGISYFCPVVTFDKAAFLKSFANDRNGLTKELVNLAVWYGKGSYWDKGYEDFFNAYEKLSPAARQTPIANAFFAAACAETKREGDARKALDSIKIADVEDAPLLSFIGETYIKLNEHEQALAYGEKAIAQDKGDIAGYIVKGKALSEDSEKSRMAIFEYLLATGRNPIDEIWKFQTEGIDYLGGLEKANPALFTKELANPPVQWDIWSAMLHQAYYDKKHKTVYAAVSFPQGPDGLQPEMSNPYFAKREGGVPQTITFAGCSKQQDFEIKPDTTYIFKVNNPKCSRYKNINYYDFTGFSMEGYSINDCFAGNEPYETILAKAGVHNAKIISMN